MLKNTYDWKNVDGNKKPKIIAVDFDGTLCEKDEWPKIGEPDVALIEYLKERRAMGDKLILWTNRTGQQLKEAVDWCATEHFLHFDAVNENVPEPRKIFAHEYIDDRNALYCPQQVRPQFVAYVCDETACEKGCPRTECYHTLDIDHAKNFKKLINGKYMELLGNLDEKVEFKPFADTPEVWIFSHDCDDGSKCYRHKDRCSLFKTVYPDKTVKYDDTQRFNAINLNMATVAYYSGLVNYVMEEMYPIQMPYIPEDKPYEVVCENFLAEAGHGDFDTYAIFFVIKPNGGRVEVNRYFKESEESDWGWVEIDEEEYVQRKILSLELKKG